MRQATESVGYQSIVVLTGAGGCWPAGSLWVDDGIAVEQSG
ncbi:MAG: hypothetical protein MAG794_01042 [Gammaproteobacteria bacterium]|nr:hypothetical protein [Gammaproteobacteria bacterium]